MMGGHSLRVNFGLDGNKIPDEDADYNSNPDVVNEDEPAGANDQYAPSQSIAPALTTQSTQSDTIAGPKTYLQTLVSNSKVAGGKDWSYEGAMRDWKKRVDTLGAELRESIAQRNIQWEKEKREKERLRLEAKKRREEQKSERERLRLEAMKRKEEKKGQRTTASTNIHVSTDDVLNAEGEGIGTAKQKAVNDATARIAAIKQANEDRAAKRRELGPDGMVFTTKLRNMKKSELQDLCWTLGLQEDGMVGQLTTRINDKFEADPELKDSNQFIGIFPRKRRKIDD